MKTTVSTVRAALAAAALLGATAAQATLVTSDYFATANVNGVFNSPEAKPVTDARATFVSMVNVLKTESLELIAPGTATNNLGLFGGTATILPPATGSVTNIISDGQGGVTGRFNTTQGCNQFTGCNFIETSSGFTLDFGADYSAFAFYGTDFSDFSGTVYIDLMERDANGNLVVVAGSRIQLAGPVGSDALLTTNGSGDGSLLNFGFTDDARSYAGISFTVVQSSTGGITDYLGFDDMILGNYKGGTSGSLPEPASLALAGLALAAAAATRRRRPTRG